MIDNILSRDIHHNISISFSKIPDYDDIEGYSPLDTAGDLVHMFKCDFEDIRMTPQNDCGNRNVGNKCELKGEVWSGGRSGATLYWDAYYTQHGAIKYHECELEDMHAQELKEIIKDLDFYDEKINELMNDFYSSVKNEIEDIRAQQHEEELAEKKYQQIKEQVQEQKCLKRLIVDLLQEGHGND